MKPSFFVTSQVAIVALILVAPAVVRAAEPLEKTTAVYKRVGSLEIKADVYRPDDDVVRPVVVWIHGGALIAGHRLWVGNTVLDWAARKGYAVVSIDYRLAPETKLPEIIADVEDAFRWIRGDGGEQFHLDSERLVVGGGSAGGYLTLLSGFRVEPRPKALLALYGYGDLIGDWYSTPSPHARHQEPKLSYADARRPVSGAPVSDPGENQQGRFWFYNHCRQQGIWPREVSGWDPETEPEKFFPFMPIKNVTESYPPTALIHGTADTDVPYELSTQMVEEFERNGVPHRLFSIPNAEHGLAGGDRGLIEQAYRSAFEFLDEYLE